jgi:hypothetical protein
MSFFAVHSAASMWILSDNGWEKQGAELPHPWRVSSLGVLGVSAVWFLFFRSAAPEGARNLLIRYPGLTPWAKFGSALRALPYRRNGHCELLSAFLGVSAVVFSLGRATPLDFARGRL